MMQTKQDITLSNTSNLEKKCSKCERIKTLNDFPTWKGKKRSQCKVCVAEKSRLWRIENPEYATAYMKSYFKSNKNEMYAKRDLKKKEIADWKSSRGCMNCGEREPCCLDMHHLNPMEKEMTPSKTATLKHFLSEADKCILLCSNCHRKVHSNVLVVTETMIQNFKKTLI